MGGARNCSFIGAHFLLSAYFLAAKTYKRMRLITRAYGIKERFQLANSSEKGLLKHFIKFLTEYGSTP